jgi:hypothetical protein
MEIDPRQVNGNSEQDSVGQVNTDGCAPGIDDYKQAYEVSKMLGDAWYQAAIARRK